jgi:hypothetical protein
MVLRLLKNFDERHCVTETAEPLKKLLLSSFAPANAAYISLYFSVPFLRILCHVIDYKRGLNW